MLDDAPVVTALRAAIARLFYAGLPGPTLDDDTRRLHAQAPFGGVVLFRANASEPRPMRELVRTVHDLDPALPPLVAIDHEGGRVHRLSPPFTRFPPAATVATHGVRAVRDVATAMARELAAVEIDLTFAPVLDVASNPANPVIGDRSYGSDPDTVTRCALTAFRASRAVGIVTCGKHFPGHGDTATDSHLELPVVDRARRELAKTELPPFRAAVAARMPMLMSAHVRYPSLDPQHPATLSRRILTTMLRRQWRYRGVICTDDLEMQAIAAHHTMAEAAVAAIAAGVDILLVCHGQHHVMEAVDAVEEAVKSGRLDEQRIRESHRRVTALTRWRLRHRRQVPLSAIGTHAHRDLNDRVAAPRS